jgi:hypothetical protein
MAITRLGPNQSVNLASNVTGTLPTANGGTGATSFAPGKVLQVVSSAISYQKTVSGSTSQTDVESASGTTWETAITPSATSSKILIMSNLHTVGYHNGGSQAKCQTRVFGKIGSGSYSELKYAETGGYDYGGSGMAFHSMINHNYMWSPSTTSECKVKFTFHPADTSQTSSISYDAKPTNVLLYEIGA